MINLTVEETRKINILYAVASGNLGFAREIADTIPDWVFRQMPSDCRLIARVSTLPIPYDMYICKSASGGVYGLTFDSEELEYICNIDQDDWGEILAETYF